MSAPDYSKRPKLLCVDDERNILVSLKRTLRNSGYDIHLAESAEEALTLLEEQAIDLIISDLKMPDKSGLELLKEVSEKWPETARILMTGFSDLESTIKAINESHIFAYIGKPWDDNDITQIISASLKVHFLEKERKRLLRITHSQNKKLKQFNEHLEAKVKQSTSELDQMTAMIEMSEIDSDSDSTIEIVNSLCCAISLIKGTHIDISLKVAELSLQLAKAVVNDKYLKEQIYFAGRLFELGKLHLPTELLTTPVIKLTAEERAQYYLFSVYGERALLNFPSLWSASNILREQCEYCNGSGYPKQLKQDIIGIGARVLSIAKDYCLFQIGRFSGEKKTSEEALTFIQKQSGKLYDPDLVKHFIPIARNYEKNRLDYQEPKTTHNISDQPLLARDCICPKSGQLLFAQGTLMSDFILSKLQDYERYQNVELKLYVEKTGEPNA